MYKFICLVFLALAAAAPAPEKEPVYGPPEPYSYSYESEVDGGKVARSESTDGSGVIIGSYSIAESDGRLRVVEYTAGPEGFQANIRTNEPGTKQENSAGVQIEANPIEVAASPVAAPLKPVAAVAPALRTVAVPQRAPLTYISLAPQVQPQTLSLGAQGLDASKYVLVSLDQLGLAGLHH